MKTTITSGRSSENGGRFAGGHFPGGHDGMANLSKPIRAYDFHVRYNKMLFSSSWWREGPNVDIANIHLYSTHMDSARPQQCGPDASVPNTVPG